jgi:hypothetical protein
MDIQSIVGSLIGLAQENPSILGSLVEHPYSTVRTVSGTQDVSRQEAAEVVTAVSSLAQGNAVDFGTLAGLAGTLLGQNNNSVHSLAGSLFGSLLGMPTQASVQQVAEEPEAPAMQLDLGKLATVAGSLLAIANATGITTKKTKKSGVDLSDGIGLDDVAGLASTLLSNNSKKKTGGIDLSDGIGLDDVIGIAGTMLGGK